MTRIKLHLLPLLLLIITAVIMTGYTPAKQKKVLVFSKTAGFRHKDAIIAGKKEIPLLGKKNKFVVDTTESADVFTTENLKKYSAVVFLCTTGNVLNEQQQQAFFHGPIFTGGTLRRRVEHFRNGDATPHAQDRPPLGDRTGRGPARVRLLLRAAQADRPAAVDVAGRGESGVGGRLGARTAPAR